MFTSLLGRCSVHAGEGIVVNGGNVCAEVRLEFSAPPESASSTLQETSKRKLSSSDRKISASALSSIELQVDDCLMPSMLEGNSVMVLFCSLSTFMDSSSKTDSSPSLRTEVTMWRGGVLVCSVMVIEDVGSEIDAYS